MEAVVSAQGKAIPPVGWPRKEVNAQAANTWEQEVAIVASQMLGSKWAQHLEKASRLVLAGKVVPLSQHGIYEVRGDTGLHTINSAGKCTCSAGIYHPDMPCSHSTAAEMHKRCLAGGGLSLLASQEEESQMNEEPIAPAHKQIIPPQYIVEIQGRKAVVFHGLLDLAHREGMESLIVTFVTVTAEFAVCQATVKFQDGRVFSDIGDATPGNVTKRVAPHFIRVASTRAKARALRNALNIDMIALEELDLEESDEEGGGAREALFARIAARLESQKGNKEEWLKQATAAQQGRRRAEWSIAYLRAEAMRLGA